MRPTYRVPGRGLGQVLSPGNPDLLVIVLKESLLLLVLRKVCLCEHFNALGIVRTFEDKFVQRSSFEKKA